jgi:hypothetical protein
MLRHFRFHSMNNRLVNSLYGSLSLLMGAIAAASAASSANINKTTGGGGLHPTWVSLCRVPQVAWDASPADRGPFKCGQMGQDNSVEKLSTSRTKTMTMKRTMSHPRTGGFQVQVPLALFVWPRGALWASGACGPCAGHCMGILGGCCVSRLVSDLGIFSVPILVADQNVHRGITWRPTASPLTSGRVCVA